MRKRRSLLIAGALTLSLLVSGAVTAYADTDPAAEAVEEVAVEEAAEEEAPAEEAAAEEEAPAEEAAAEEEAPAEEAAAEEEAPAEEAAAEEEAPAEEAAAEEEAPAEEAAAEEEAKPAARLTGLTVRDISLKDIFEGFDAEKTEYEINVQSDIYGVLIDPEAPLGTKITVTADKDALAYDGTVNYEAGSKVPYDFDLDGYVVQLGQAYEDYDSEFVQTVTITASAAGESKDYTLVITRADDTEVYKLFEAKEFTDSAGTTIPYELYVPTNYDETKKYPIVFALHGSGQRTQPLDMVLKRYQMATVWAKDSEAGHNECIVLAPQCTVEDANLENWTSLMANRAGEAEDTFQPSPQLDAAYELLQEVMGEYSIDADRVYMTGLSAGGWATFALAEMYPDTFAAIAPDASAADPKGIEALKGIPMWIFQAADDPTVPVDDNYYPTIKALDAAGIDYKRTVYKNGDVFFPSAHFSWVAMYADEEFRDWMFAQSKGGEPEAVLSDDISLAGLEVRDGTLKDIFEGGFKPEKNEYQISVQSDIYGVLVSPEAPEGATLTVTADKDALAYDETVNYEAGTAIPYDEKLGGYIVQLGQAYEDYDSEFVQTATITVSNDTASKDYKVVITREDDTDVYGLFEEKEFTDSKGTVIPYEIYVPTSYDETKEYPVVFALHGSGQRTQPLDMVLKRYQMATIWAKDSEAGHNECIVLAPQCTVEDENLENWTSLMAYSAGEAEDSFTPAPQLDAAYELLQNVLNEYSCDRERVYMTGLSAGGWATFALAEMYPETFAAIAPDASAANPEGIEALKDMPMWIFQAGGDPAVPTDKWYYPTIAALDAAGIEYKRTFYKEGDVFFPTAHFSWVPMYADEEFRDWMFAQSRGNLAAGPEDAVLTGLEICDATQKEIFNGYMEGKTEYAVNVQSDIYGVLVAPKAPKGAKITVTADVDANAYDGSLNYEAGTEIPYNDKLGGYVVQLGQEYDDYDSEFIQTVTIQVSAAGSAKDYKVVITRADDTDVYDLFQAKEFTDSAGTTIPYELYVPTNYDETKKYPIVFALHGSGQRTQPLDMVLKRYQMATVWAKDSEAGHNECIVLAPQCTVEDANLENWTSLMANRAGEAEDTFQPSPQLDAAYELLQEVMGEYSIDADRVYMTGLSAGGWATFALAEMYPDTFAAIAPDASAADPKGIEALKGIPMWIFQAADDPTVPVADNYYPTIAALDNAGIEYKATVYKNGSVFFPSAHFSWVPMYADEEFRDWMFAQKKQ